MQLLAATVWVALTQAVSTLHLIACSSSQDCLFVLPFALRLVVPFVVSKSPDTPEMVHRIALIRHGESVWNLENIFTGWTDVDLSATGKKEAIQAGKLLRTEGFKFDLAYTSVLKRAIKTLQNVLEELDQLWVPVEKSWRLNERHYGDLQGRNKADTAKKFGDKQVHIWRRSYDVPPAELEGGKDDPRFPGSDRRYAHNKPEDLPVTESLKTTVERFMPLWTDTIAPAVKSGKNVIIAAHGNSLRALVKYLDNVSDEDIPSLEIPTGVPLIYELDDNLKPIRHYYVGTKEAFKKKIGFLGADGQAERMTDAFVHHGVVMKPDEIKYHAPKADAAIEKLGLHDAPTAAEVVKASDVLFLFGSLADIRDTIKSIKGDLKGNQIVVPVTKEGDLDVFQNAAGGMVRVIQAVPEDELKWQKGVNAVGTHVSLRKGSSTAELDGEIVKTLFEAAGYPIDEDQRSAMTAGG